MTPKKSKESLNNVPKEFNQIKRIKNIKRNQFIFL